VGSVQYGRFTGQTSEGAFTQVVRGPHEKAVRKQRVAGGFRLKGTTWLAADKAAPSFLS
jgi:hypothetical protein